MFKPEKNKRAFGSCSEMLHAFPDRILIPLEPVRCVNLIAVYVPTYECYWIYREAIPGEYYYVFTVDETPLDVELLKERIIHKIDHYIETSKDIQGLLQQMGFDK